MKNRQKSRTGTREFLSPLINSLVVVVVDDDPHPPYPTRAVANFDR